VGLAGDRLPYTARFSGNLSADQKVALTKRVTGFVGASISYVGAREGQFPTVFSPPERQILPGYAQTDLRAGVIYDSWAINLFVNNVADKRGLLTGGINSLYPFAFDYIQPRTAGLSISKSFSPK
jgi:hypothetical protein